jgi:hypothetical protein
LAQRKVHLFTRSLLLVLALGLITGALDSRALLPATALAVPASDSSIYLPLAPKAFPAEPTQVSWVTILEENFEGAFPGPWTRLDAGSWPGEYLWARSSCRPSAGSYSGWGFGDGANGAGKPCGASYPPGVESWLVYGPFSLAEAVDAELTFKYWVNTEPEVDVLFVGASKDGNNYLGAQFDGASGSWKDGLLDLQNGAFTGEAQVWIAFVFSTDLEINASEGAYVDNIVLRKAVPDRAESRR